MNLGLPIDNESSSATKFSFVMRKTWQVLYVVNRYTCRVAIGGQKREGGRKWAWFCNTTILEYTNKKKTIS